MEPFRASAWLGKAIMLVLTGLLVLVTYAVPIAVSAILATSLAALILGAGSLIWLLKHYRKRLLAQETVC